MQLDLWLEDCPDFLHLLAYIDEVKVLLVKLVFLLASRMVGRFALYWMRNDWHGHIQFFDIVRACIQVWINKLHGINTRNTTEKSLIKWLILDIKVYL